MSPARSLGRTPRAAVPAAVIRTGTLMDDSATIIQGVPSKLAILATRTLISENRDNETLFKDSMSQKQGPKYIYTMRQSKRKAVEISGPNAVVIIKYRKK